MILWIDAHFSPVIAGWMQQTFSVQALALRDIGLRDAEDDVIFAAAKTAGAVVMTKDADFLNLLAKHDPPPQIVWVTYGNTSNVRLKEILLVALPPALLLLASGERLVEIRDAQLPLEDASD